ncbi:helix-turn-helix domain-containing protein [Kitasatospora sp. NPDC004669]|uniref:helix-turn-helix domain-containing protein n=1 Tax=Kitasatospora sp. NPDC004669 TaxID=3154555 RepID=UPI0033B9DB6E
MRYADGGGLTAAGRAKRERVRFEAAELFEQGVRPPEVARCLRVSRKSAYAWYARWRDGGVEALVSKGSQGGSRGIKGGCRNGSRTLVDLTVAEIRRLLAAGRPHFPRPPRCSPRAHALNWSTWRRERQAVARRCHYQRRLHTIEGRPSEDRP